MNRKLLWAIIIVTIFFSGCTPWKNYHHNDSNRYFKDHKECRENSRRAFLDEKEMVQMSNQTFWYKKCMEERGYYDLQDWAE
jgi:hypothetical protein